MKRRIVAQLKIRTCPTVPWSHFGSNRAHRPQSLKACNRALESIHRVRGGRRYEAGAARLLEQAGDQVVLGRSSHPEPIHHVFFLQVRLVFVCAALMIVGCKRAEVPSTTPVVVTLPTPVPAATRSHHADDFLRSFEGTIGGKKVEGTLARSGDVVWGAYRYVGVTKEHALWLEGIVDLRGEIRLEETNRKDEKPVATGALTGAFSSAASFAGTWSSVDGTRSLPILIDAKERSSAATYAFEFEGRVQTLLYQGASGAMDSVGSLETVRSLVLVHRGAIHRLGDIRCFAHGACTLDHLDDAAEVERFVAENTPKDERVLVSAVLNCSCGRFVRQPIVAFVVEKKDGKKEAVAFDINQQTVFRRASVE